MYQDLDFAILLDVNPERVELLIATGATGGIMENKTNWLPHCITFGIQSFLREVEKQFIFWPKKRTWEISWFYPDPKQKKEYQNQVLSLVVLL